MHCEFRKINVKNDLYWFWKEQKNNIFLFIGSSDHKTLLCVVEGMDKLTYFTLYIGGLAYRLWTWPSILLVITPPWYCTQANTHLPEFTLHLYLLNTRSNKIKLARWNPTFVLFDGGMKWDSINTRSPTGWLTPNGGSIEKVRHGNYAGGVAEEMGVRRRWFCLDH